MHYVVGDVHGCYTELMALIKKIEQQDYEAQFIFVGDWVDRGTSQMATLLWMLDNITETGKYQSVRGNHDQDAWDWYQTKYLPWRKWNTDCEKEKSMPPYSKYDFYEVVQNDFAHNMNLLEPIMEKLHTLPYNKLIEVETKNNVQIKYRIAHAWHESREDATNWQRIQANLYIRKFAIGNRENPDEIYVHGHTPTIVQDYYMCGDKKSERPGMISYRENAINVDGGCCFQKEIEQFPCMLCGICLETLEEFYCDSVENRLKLAAEYYYRRKPYKVGNKGLDVCVHDMVARNIRRYEKAEEDKYRKEILKRMGVTH